MRLSLLLSGALALALHGLLFVGAESLQGGAESAAVAPRAVRSVRTVLRPASPVPSVATPAPPTTPVSSDPALTVVRAVASPVAPPRRLAVAARAAASLAAPASRAAPAFHTAPPLPAAAGEFGAGEPPLPTYLTQLPPPFAWSYRLRRGTHSGIALLSWQRASENYEARLVGQLGAASIIDWTSRGSFDAAGIAPERFTVQRKGRPVHAANFRREAERPKISYSGPAIEYDLPRGAQDRLSWIVQLASIAAAEPQRLAEDGQIVVFVSGARGDAGRWTFAVVGRESVDTEQGRVDAIRLLREAQRPYDTRAEVWLDPLRHHLPVRATLVNSPGGEALELLVMP